MNKIHNKIKDFIKHYHIDSPEITYLIGFSGGFDSMCLLDSLHKIMPKNRIIAIHLNHNWRGNESNEEEANCRKFCKKNNIEFYSESLTAPQNETDSRDIRYDFFYRCAKKFNSNVIFTAHNKNDNVETLIFRIAHGTGVKGLCGIAPKRDIFYRPMLNIERIDIEKYCCENHLNPNSDSSNQDNIHKRNFIRNEILPKLKEINPNIIESVSSLIQIANDETEIINNYVEDVISNISKNGKILTDEFLKLPYALKMRLLYKIITPLVPQNYDKTRIETILNFIEKNSGSKSGKTVSVTTDKWIFVSQKFIELVHSKSKKDLIICINNTGEYHYDGIFITLAKCDSAVDRICEPSLQSFLVDFSGLNFDFELRTRKDGDIIQPFGMKGHKKLKKYLNEKKIPNHEKDKLLLLAQGKEILWIEGIGVSEKIRVRTKPTHLITIERNNNES